MEISLKSCEYIQKNQHQMTIVDVREPVEFQAEHIEGSINMPLSQLKDKIKELNPEQPIALVCKGGIRAQRAADLFLQSGFKQMCVMQGGLEAWKQTGCNIQIGVRRVWAMDRQVRFTAGSLVLIGLITGWLIHPWFYLLSAFVGGGLVFSAITDTCGMAMLLSKMPWNKVK